jgi:hypothetical protein
MDIDWSDYFLSRDSYSPVVGHFTCGEEDECYLLSQAIIWAQEHDPICPKKGS